MPFRRSFKDTAALKQESLFSKKIRPDATAPFKARSGIGDIFPAVRVGRIDFYHKGGKLFSYRTRSGFSTHHKFGSVIFKPVGKDYVKEQELKVVPSFTKAYERIKENCALYSGVEAAGVAQIYCRYSCTKKTRAHQIVVLDIEISMERLGGRASVKAGKAKKTPMDRIDLLLMDTKTGLLRFFEAKHHTNPEIRAQGEGRPRVVGQIGRYERQLGDSQVYQQVLDAYRNYVDIINDLFRPTKPLPHPTAIDPKPRLLVYGFDGPQQPKLRSELAKLKKNHGVQSYAIGNIAQVKPAPSSTVTPAGERRGICNMKLTIYRGAREIGGSCVELSASNSRILVDLGIPLVQPDGNSFDLADHDGTTGPELVNAGILPDVAGLYRWQEPGIAGVLISHGHQDHYGFLDYVHPAIPVFMGEGTAKLIEITALFSRRGQAAGPVKTFSWPDSFDIGVFTITPHLVDHSCFGAFAFEIEADGKRVVYSGDFRDHGHIGKATDVMLNRVAPGADALLLEGTMTGRSNEKVLTEQEVADRAADICRRSPSLIAVYQSGQNVSRAVSLFKAARATDRTLVLDVYTAHVLKELGRLPGGESLPHAGNPRYRGIRVWYPKRLTDHLFRNGHDVMANSLAQFKIRRRKSPCAVSPAKARSPASISYKTQPREKMSERPSVVSPRNCSGAM